MYINLCCPMLCWDALIMLEWLEPLFRPHEWKSCCLCNIWNKSWKKITWMSPTMRIVVARRIVATPARLNSITVGWFSQIAQKFSQRCKKLELLHTLFSQPFSKNQTECSLSDWLPSDFCHKNQFESQAPPQGFSQTCLSLRLKSD